MKKIKVILATLSLMLMSLATFADNYKDSVKAEVKVYMDQAVILAETITGQHSLFGIPFTFIASILSLIIVGIIVAAHNKRAKEQNAAHQETIKNLTDAHAKTIENLTKK